MKKYSANVLNLELDLILISTLQTCRLHFDRLITGTMLPVFDKSRNVRIA